MAKWSRESWHKRLPGDFEARLEIVRELIGAVAIEPALQQAVGASANEIQQCLDAMREHGMTGKQMALLVGYAVHNGKRLFSNPGPRS